MLYYNSFIIYKLYNYRIYNIMHAEGIIAYRSAEK